MKSLIAMTSALCAVALSFPAAQAQEKAARIAAAAVETVVTVVDVDREGRVVTVVGPEGRQATFNVPPEAQNLDQVQPGSRFKVAYLVSVVVALSKSHGTPAAGQVTDVEFAPKGDIPGGVIVHTQQIDAVVEKVDHANRLVTVIGPAGGVRELKVDESVQAFDQVAVGDTVTLQYTEGLAMRMIRE